MAHERAMTTLQQQHLQQQQAQQQQQQQQQAQQQQAQAQAQALEQQAQQQQQQQAERVAALRKSLEAEHASAVLDLRAELQSREAELQSREAELREVQADLEQARALPAAAYPPLPAAPHGGVASQAGSGVEGAEPARAVGRGGADEAARAAAGRLGIFSPAGVLCTAAGPAWARGELEPPQGARRTVSGFAAAVYTPEQQERLVGVRVRVWVQP